MARSIPALYSSTLPPARRNGRLTSSIWMRPSWTDAVAFAISISLRAAFSGSANGRSAVNFIGFVGCGDMWNMDQVMLQVMTVEDFTAGTFHVDAAGLPG